MNVDKTIRQLVAAFQEKSVSARNLPLGPSSRASLGSGNLPLYPIWFYSPIHGIPRTGNVAEVRQFAKSAWYQMVANAIRKAVVQTPWDIVADTDEENAETRYAAEIEYVRTFLEHPNREERMTYESIIEQVLNDVLEINTGVLYLNGSKETMLVEVIPYDASTFLIEQDPNGFLKNYWQFSYRNPVAAPKQFSPDDLAWFQMNRKSYDPYAMSPLMAVQMVVEMLDQATRYNKDFFLKNAIPALLINLVGANPLSLEEFRESWLQENEGTNSQLTMVNAPGIQVEKLAQTNRDMEWLEGQKWYMHLMFAAYGISPTEVGFTDSTGSKNVQEGQQEITVKNAHKPYLHLISGVLSRHVIPRILGEANLPYAERTPIMHKYFVEDAEMERAEEDGQRQDVAAHIITINEVRKERGLPPLKGKEADDPFAQQETAGSGGQGDGARGGASQGDGGGKEAKAATGKHADPRAGQRVATSARVVRVEDAEDEAETYEKFFDTLLGRWEAEVMRAFHSKLSKGARKGVVKDFGAFLTALMSSVTLLPFLNLLNGVVRSTMKIGVKAGARELGVDLRVGPAFSGAVQANVNRQLDGYTLPDGAKWPGLKGVGDQLQVKIMRAVRDGHAQSLPVDQIAAEIREIFRGVRESRAMAIARTETVRMVNEGKLSAYKDSGVAGKKQWVALLDKNPDGSWRTSHTCRHLNGQVRELHEHFDGPDGFGYDKPPAHVNCRSFIRFIPD